ncbi:MAG: SCO1664 family protein [Anaerolineaceae bacterium]|nr:SCO1664 family protein [Anaerolineaceae bacterium]
MQGQFMYASNYTFLVDVIYEAETYKAVYKPVQGERPLWDFPTGTLSQREAAAFIVSEALGWNLVPPTVYVETGPYGAGSIQIYIDHDLEAQQFPFKEEDETQLKRIAVFDVLINNADRKFGHILRDHESYLWCIDHGICFHEEDKLRTVVWDFVGEKFSQSIQNDLMQVSDELVSTGALYEHLRSLIVATEIEALRKRAENLAKTAQYPYPDETKPHIPWPPV